MKGVARHLWLSTAMIALFAIPLEAAEYNPFQIPRAEFFAAVRTIALWPTSLPTDTADPEALREVIEEMMTTSLSTMGFEVIPSDQIRARWEEISGSVGGVVDPITGESNEDEVALLRGLIKQEFALERGADAFLSSSVSMGAINVWAKARDDADRKDGEPDTVWMAGHEEIEWNGAAVGSLWINRPQEARGFRLTLKMSDPTDIALYDIMLPIRWNRIYLRGSYDDRAETTLLDHKERLETVINVLIRQLSEPDQDPSTLATPPPSSND